DSNPRPPACKALPGVRSGAMPSAEVQIGGGAATVGVRSGPQGDHVDWLPCWLPLHQNGAKLSCVAGTLGRRTVLAAGVGFLAAAIGLTTLRVALTPPPWGELEAVLTAPLIVGGAIARGWTCLLGVALRMRWTWSRWSALLTFVVVGAVSGWAGFETGRVGGGG